MILYVFCSHLNLGRQARIQAQVLVQKTDSIKGCKHLIYGFFKNLKKLVQLLFCDFFFKEIIFNSRSQ